MHLTALLWDSITDVATTFSSSFITQAVETGNITIVRLLLNNEGVVMTSKLLSALLELTSDDAIFAVLMSFYEETMSKMEQTVPYTPARGPTDEKWSKEESEVHT